MSLSKLRYRIKATIITFQMIPGPVFEEREVCLSESSLTDETAELVPV